MMLSDMGYTVIAAPDAMSALSRLREGIAIDLVITDYRMPGMNGIEFIRALRKFDPVLPVIIITGVDIPEVDPRLGVFASLLKPVKGNILDRAIKQAIEHAEMKSLLLSVVS